MREVLVFENALERSGREHGSPAAIDARYFVTAGSEPQSFCLGICIDAASLWTDAP